jgi:hypothetical protein
MSGVHPRPALGRPGRHGKHSCRPLPGVHPRPAMHASLATPSVPRQQRGPVTRSEPWHGLVRAYWLGASPARCAMPWWGACAMPWCAPQTPCYGLVYGYGRRAIAWCRATWCHIACCPSGSMRPADLRASIAPFAPIAFNASIASIAFIWQSRPADLRAVHRHEVRVLAVARRRRQPRPLHPPHPPHVPSRQGRAGRGLSACVRYGPLCVCPVQASLRVSGTGLSACVQYGPLCGRAGRAGHSALPRRAYPPAPTAPPAPHAASSPKLALFPRARNQLHSFTFASTPYTHVCAYCITTRDKSGTHGPAPHRGKGIARAHTLPPTAWWPYPPRRGGPLSPVVPRPSAVGPHGPFKSPSRHAPSQSARHTLPHSRRDTPPHSRRDTRQAARQVPGAGDLQ